MTSKDLSAPEAVVNVSVPSAARRLSVPVATAETFVTLSPEQATKSGSSSMRKNRKLTPLRRLERYISAIFKLGRTEGMAKDARKRVTAAELRMDAIEGELDKLGQEIHQLWQNNDNLRNEMIQDIRSEHALIGRIFSDLSRRMDLIAQQDATGSIETKQTPVLPASEGFDLFKDNFYHRLENRYRGSLEEITKRLQIYIPDVEAAYLRTGGKPAMDIGCGRGEWLGLLKGCAIDAFGIDTNPVQIDAAQEQGLDVRLGNALEALAEMEDNSISLLSAHHLVEHIPFESVAWITREAMRVLAPGGILLFETPNVRNVLVGATSFHTDPTHIKPMPEQVLTVLFETAGFNPIEVRALHPHERFNEFMAKPDFNNELAFLMFGPQDLTVLGTKPIGD